MNTWEVVQGVVFMAFFGLITRGAVTRHRRSDEDLSPIADVIQLPAPRQATETPETSGS